MILTLAEGRFRLVFGDETAVLAEEVSTSGDSTRLGADDMPATWAILGKRDVIAEDYEIVLILTANIAEPHQSQEHEPLSGCAVITAHDDDNDLLVRAVRDLEPETREAMIAEAAAAAWCQRLSDAADTAKTLNSDDDAILGPLSVAGAPTMTQLRAERRRTLAGRKHAASEGGGDVDLLQDALEVVIHDLHMKVRYGSSELAATTTPTAEAIAAATSDDGWATHLRLLLAAEESYAIGILISVLDYLSNQDAGFPAGNNTSALSCLGQHRQQSEELAGFLAAAIKRAPARRKTS